MYQYYILEIKRTQADEYEHEVFWTFDKNADTARLQAERKYHELLAVAATSVYKTHSVTVVSADGLPILNYCYRHPLPEENESE